MQATFYFVCNASRYPDHHFHDLLRVPDLARGHLVGITRVQKLSGQIVVCIGHVKRHGSSLTVNARFSF